MGLRLLARLAVLLGSLSLAVPAWAASFGTGADRATITDQTFGLPGSSCSGVYSAPVNLNLPPVQTGTGSLTYTLEGAPSGLTRNGFTLSGTLVADLRQASAVSHTLTWMATDDDGSDSLTFEIAIVDERPALEALYTSTNGANWTTSTNWAAHIPAATCLHDLHGVTLQASGTGVGVGRVSGINLSSNNLTGEIPESLGNPGHGHGHGHDEDEDEETHEDEVHLRRLKVLNLSSNNLTGEIPEGLNYLPSLSTINLSSNRLTGEIPEDITDLHFLDALDLSHNQLTGQIPTIHDSHNRVLNLSHNQLTGQIPTTLFSGMFELASLDLSHNQLTNQLTGSIPNLPGPLDYLDLSHNQFDGEIPDALPRILTYLDLSHNRFSGEISAVFPRGLTYLDLSHNQLSGEISAVFPRGLTDLDLSHNQLGGEISAVFPAGLFSLDLSYNQLTGIAEEFPTSFGTATEFAVISFLDFSHNQLTGRIPEFLPGIGSLTHLDLSHNQLTGPIVTGMDGLFLFSLSILTHLDLSHNQLNGEIPDLPSFLQKLYLHNNQLEGSLDSLALPPLAFLSLYDNPRVGRPTLYGYPASLNTKTDLHLVVPSVSGGYRMCLYGDADGAGGTTPCTIPTQVDELILFPSSPTELAASWAQPDPAPSGYVVQYETTDWVDTNVKIHVPTLPNSASARITGLTPGESYRVRVRPASEDTPWLLSTITLPSESDDGGGDDGGDGGGGGGGGGTGGGGGGGGGFGGGGGGGGTTPGVSLSASPNPVDEGSAVTVTATLTAALSADVTIPLTLTHGTAEDRDYGTLASITVTAGQTAGTGTIATEQDTDADDETFTVALGTLPTAVTEGSPSSVEVTITDDEKPSVSLDALPNPVDEGSAVTVTATLTAALSADVTIPLTLTHGTAEDRDYGTLASITVTAGQTAGTGTIATEQDTDADDETFTVALGTLPTAVTEGSPSSVEVTITDDEKPSVSLDALPNPVDEGSTVTVTATLSAALSADVTIPLTLTHGTAEDGDYDTLASITVTAGQTAGTGTIATNQDPDTDDETFTVALGALPASVTAGTPSSVEITITDDEKPSVSLDASPNPVDEGSAVTVTATLTAVLSADVTIPLTLTAGTAEDGDYGSLPSITINGGATSGTGTVSTTEDADRDDETFMVALGTLPAAVTEGSPSSVEVTIRDTTAAQSRLFVPIVLQSAGRTGGSFFTSEMILTNRGPTTAAIGYTYRAAYGGGSGTAVDSLGAGEQRVIADAIAHLRALGVPVGSSPAGGTLRVDFSNLSLASDAAVTLRVTTPVEEGGGRAGLSYYGVDPAGLLTGPAFITGLRRNERDRSNLAIQNAGVSGGITLRVTVFSGDPAAPARSLVLPDRTLPPGGFHQYNGILDLAGFDNGYVKVEPVGGTAPFYCYGVINDNFNSDGAFVFPVPESSLVGRAGQTLPVIIESGNFRSELTVTNFSASGKTVDFRFVADAVDSSDDTARFSLTLEAGEQVILPDIVEELRRQGVEGIGPADRAFMGALFATPAEGDMGGIVIGARTGSPDGRGGQYSLFYDGVPYGSAFTGSVWIYGLQQDADNRSNLALVNTGEIDDSSSTFELTIYDGSGAARPRIKSMTLGPRRWTQANGILGDTGQGYVQVRKTSGNNPFFAYGVINDGGAPGERSGDGAYLPARE